MPTVQAVQWRVAVAHRPPFIFVNDGGNGSTLYSGMLIELLNRVIATQSEAAITYSLYTSPTNAGGTLDSNGAWSGAFGGRCLRCVLHWTGRPTWECMEHKKERH